MTRTIDTGTIDTAAQYYASQFLSRPQWVMEEFFKLTFKDEFELVCAGIREHLASKQIAEFERLSGDWLKPRDDAVFHDLLASKLAIDPDGGHISGAIGSTIVGSRLIGVHDIEVEAKDSMQRRIRLGLDKSHRETIMKSAIKYWPIYAGEQDERIANSGAADDLPDGTPSLPVGALNTRISNECALLACDAVVDNLDEGSGAAVVQGRTGAQPAGADVAVTGTNLFTLICSDPAFGAAVDAAPGGRATASSITDDSSADATGTLGYCRASSTNDGATPIDDHIDGEAGTSGADYNFNTLAIVAGATISLTSWTVTQPES